VTNSPKYSILANAIRKKIAGGTYRDGDKLPSENELSLQYGYSRQTVRQAFGVLEEEGLLRRERGSGTYVHHKMKNSAKTMTIGVITTYITDYIFPSIIRGIESELTHRGYSLTLGVTKNRVENENKILHSFIDKKVDGIIVEGTQTAFPNPNITLYKQLDECGIPYVFFNGFYRDLPCVHITTNDRECGAAAAEYLIQDKHCKKLGGIFKSDDMQGHERYAGFAEGVLKCQKELDDDAVIWFTTAEKESLFSEHNADVVLKRLEGCSGIVCYNDQVAYSLIKLLEKYDSKVPNDVAVIGYDNANLLEYSSLKITTFEHPKEKMGSLAASKIVNLVENSKAEKSEVLRMNMIVK